MERNCVKDDICLLDHHQRFHWNTITIGLKGMINWVQQLNNSQLENSFNSHLEKHFNLVLPSQPNSLNPLKIEWSNLWPKRLLVSRKENLVLLIERGNLRKRKKRVLKSHDRTGQPVEGRLHRVQEDGYLKNRDDADKFNIAMDDENIDFNITTWQIEYYSPTLACISPWCGCYFGRFQHMWSGRRTIQCLEPDINRSQPGKDWYVPFFLAIRPWGCPI